MEQQRIPGRRTLEQLSDSERQGLDAVEDDFAKALLKAMEDPDGLEDRVDFARVANVPWDRFWMEYCLLNVQREKARLGLDWVAPQTSERTVDGKPIVHGMRVFTNNLDRGTVDLSTASWSNARDGKKSLWFDVKIDTNFRGEAVSKSYQQNGERIVTRFEGQDA